MRGRSSAAR
uniref:Uncharacterized protein n=1 Tax=Arundo donax TaxID=35708 RepID=A0A0A8Z547_ARUDO